MRKRGPYNNKATKASQRIDYVEDEDPKAKKQAKPKGRSVGGPWIRRSK